MDLLNKRVSVYPLINGAVTGQSIKHSYWASWQFTIDNVLVRISKVGKKKILGNLKESSTFLTAQNRYVNSMSDVCKTET